MRLLVTGAAGMLGTDVVAAARAHNVLPRGGRTSPRGESSHRREPAGRGVDLVALARTDLDITDADAVRAAVRDVRPDAVINCAAWTDVDGAENDEPAATLINGDGAGHIAAAAAELGAHVVHVSTDYVFPGDATSPYPENAPTGPIGAYGRSKLAGEVAVENAAPSSHAIVRTAWVFGPHGKNFVDTMLRVGPERGEVTVVDDQLGCPTYTGHLARALIAVADARMLGILHVAGGGQCTWFDLAVATFAQAGLDVTVQRGASADLDRPAPRPAYSVLGSTRSDAPMLPSWQEGLKAHLTAREVLAS